MAGKPSVVKTSAVAWLLAGQAGGVGFKAGNRDGTALPLSLHFLCKATRVRIENSIWAAAQRGPTGRRARGRVETGAAGRGRKGNIWVRRSLTLPGRAAHGGWFETRTIKDGHGQSRTIKDGQGGAQSRPYTGRFGLERGGRGWVYGGRLEFMPLLIKNGEIVTASEHYWRTFIARRKRSRALTRTSRRRRARRWWMRRANMFFRGSLTRTCISTCRSWERSPRIRTRRRARRRWWGARRRSSK